MVRYYGMWSIVAMVFEYLFEKVSC